ncbi:MAG: tyrosine-type recombinase/integrase [Aeromicrobium sp.]
MRDLGQSFARHLRAERRSPATLRLYGQSVEFYSRWLEAHALEATLDELTRRRITDWLSDLNEINEPSTVKTRYRGLHRFCTWLVEEDELDAHPMTGITPPSPRSKPVPVITDIELDALIRACAGKAFNDRRDEAMIRVLLDCGLRVAELCSLDVDDIDLLHDTAHVTGKGDKTRPIYFGARTVKALDRYLRARRSHRWAHLSALFLTQRGALSTDGARDIIKARGLAAGITDLHPHRFRHTFAHDFLMNGGQERDLKRLAGWTSDSMLERYGASAADARARSATQKMKRGDRV